MHVRIPRPALVLGAAAALLLGGGVALAATTGSNATCDPSPVVTVGASDQSFDVHCSVPLPPSVTSTVTETATVTVTASPTTTAAPSPTSTTPAPTSTTATPTPTTSTTTATPATDWVRPTAATTGASGSLTAWGKSTTFDGSGQTISGVEFGGYVKLTGSNIVLENCHFDGMAFYGPGPLTIRNCTSNGNINTDGYYRAISGVSLDHVHVICGDHDGIDLFSSASNRVSNVTITDSLIDGQSFPSTSTAHGDGLQVRGISGLTVERVVFDMRPTQPQKNAAIYFEDVNGGDTGMHFTDVDLYGGDPYSHTFYTNAVADSTATNLAIRAGGYVTRVKPSGWAFTNVTGPTGAQINP
jgi:hypothetical protein